MAHPVVLIVFAIAGVLLLALVAHSIWLLFTAALCMAKVAILLAPVALVVFVIRWFVRARHPGNR